MPPAVHSGAGVLVVSQLYHAGDLIMLTAEALTEALQEAGKAAGVCTRICRFGSSIEDKCMILFHNGIGDSDSDEQRIDNTIALALAQPAWQQRLESWLRRLHEHGPRLDLNTGS
jgi:hypothetical protein